MRNKGLAFGVLCMVGLLAGNGAFGPPQARSQVIAPTPTPMGIVHTAPPVITSPITVAATRDLAPQLPTSDKLMIIVQHHNGQYEQIFLAPDAETAVRQTLAASDIVVTMVPPATLVGRLPPLVAPSAGGTAPAQPLAPVVALPTPNQ